MKTIKEINITNLEIASRWKRELLQTTITPSSKSDRMTSKQRINSTSKKYREAAE